MEKPTGPTPPEKNKRKATTTGRIGPIAAIGAGVVATATFTLGCAVAEGAVRTLASAIRADGKAENNAEAGHLETARHYEKLADDKAKDALLGGLVGGGLLIGSGIVSFAVLRSPRPEDEPHPQAPSITSVPTGPPQP